jgi:hypothetical protein
MVQSIATTISTNADLTDTPGIVAGLSPADRDWLAGLFWDLVEVAPYLHSIEDHGDHFTAECEGKRVECWPEYIGVADETMTRLVEGFIPSSLIFTIADGPADVILWVRATDIGRTPPVTVTSESVKINVDFY